MRLPRPSLGRLYRILFRHFGPQHWWPAASAFEVMVGAVLTQNTNWANVAQAIANLRRRRLLTPQALARLSHARLGRHIRPAGYYNLKAVRLKNFLSFFHEAYGSSVARMAAHDTALVRAQLLAVNGIGPETADSILLYALDKPVFVVDAYTKRILARHGYLREGAEYHAVQRLFLRALRPQAGLFNEYHALFVKLGKEYCSKRNPKCRICPLGRDAVRSKK